MLEFLWKGKYDFKLETYVHFLHIGKNWRKNLWFIFRPTQIRYTPLLTYAKSAILHIRPTSTWINSG